MRNRLGPVMAMTLGICLWLTGNALMPSAPAKGQGIDPGIEAQKNPVCATDATPIYIKGQQCTHDDTTNTCTGYCDGFVIYTSHCKVPFSPETSAQCVDNPNGTAISAYYKNDGCIDTTNFTGPNYCECDQGQFVNSGTAVGFPECGYII